MTPQEILKVLYHLKDYWKGDATIDYLINIYQELEE